MFTPKGRYQFLCKSTNQPLEYINLDPSCSMEDKLLCEKHAQEIKKNSHVMKLEAFLQETRKIFVKDNYDDIDLIRKELKNSGDACKAKIDNYRLMYIETFLQLCQKVDKSVDSIISAIFKTAKEDYLERISLFENPLPSYDPHSLIYGILKGLYITTNESNVHMEVKMSQDVKTKLNSLRKTTSQFISQFDDIFLILDRNLAALKDYRYSDLSFSESSSRDKDVSPLNGLSHNHSSSDKQNNLSDLKFARGTTNSGGSPATLGRNDLRLQSNYSKDAKDIKSDDSIQDMFDKILSLGPQMPKRSLADKSQYEFETRKLGDLVTLKEIRNIKSLAINLSGHQITQDSHTAFAEALKNQTAVEVLKLDVSNNSGSMTRDALREIAAGICQLTGLKKLSANFRINDIADLEMAALSTLLRTSSLQELEILLSFNVIGDEGLKSFGKGLSQLKNLRKLKIDIQKIKAGSIGFQGLFEGISTLSGLDTLTLVMSDNGMPDDDMAVLGKCLRDCNKLRFLDIHLSHNDVKDKGMTAFSQSLSQGLTGLRDIGLDIQFNGVGYVGLKAFVKAIEERTDLEKVAMNFMDNQSIANVRINEVKKQLSAITHCQIKYKL